MTRFNVLLAVVLLAGGTMVTQSAAGQNLYTPQSPTISPWMGLWAGKNTGPLDNYHNFVLPQMELNRTLQSQNATLNRQAAGLQGLSDQMEQPPGNQAGMMATGQGATFMNYSHYYGGAKQASRVATPRFTPSTAVSKASSTASLRSTMSANMPLVPR